MPWVHFASEAIGQLSVEGSDSIGDQRCRWLSDTFGEVAFRVDRDEYFAGTSVGDLEPVDREGVDELVG